MLYATETRSGQSGAPVYITNHDKVSLVAIHKAYSKKDNLNIGVMITAELVSVL